MKMPEMDEIIKAYILQTGNVMTDRQAQTFQRLIALCDHWETIGAQDATLGHFSPPTYDSNSPFVEVYELLRECYTEGYHSIKGGP